MEILADSFDVQFNTRYKIPVRGGVVEAVDINPQELKDSTPILWIPGWAETIKINRVPLEEVQRLGRRVLTLSHARENIAAESAADLYPSIDRQAASLQTLLDYFGLDRVDAITHSEGSLAVSVVAARQPARIRNMILIGSAGILPKDSVFNLARRFIINEAVGAMLGTKTKQEKGLTSIEGALVAVKHVVSNPSWSLQELQALAGEKIIPDLENLQKSGIGISFIHNVNDRGFPIELLDRDLRNIVDEEKLAGFYSVIGNHNTVLGDPRIARLAVVALDSLEYKRSHPE